MSVLAIIRPLLATVGGSMTDPARMASSDPKEVAFSGGSGSRTIDLDLGSIQDVGAIYLGGASGAATFSISGGVGSYAESQLGTLEVAPKRSASGPRQYLRTINPARQIRYLRLTADLPGGFEVGIALAGERFSPEYGHEFGAGRFLVDTSSVGRNRAGGFGIERGAIVPGWEFTLGDLLDGEVETLFDMLRLVGESNPVVVAEDPDVTAHLDARLHYGLFQRLEKYERQSPGVTRWSLKVEEWV